VISVSIGRVALDNRPRLELLNSIIISILYSIEGASKGNRSSVLELIVTLNL
jgi:hypothetical protein